ncbi:MAG TPA: glycosyltransferase family 1 protein [Campylobacterales bacterium]|nr:glycosyltransferase family 1 protein [Campylobacterales bacterium]
MMKTVMIVVNTSWNIYNFRLNLMHSLQSSGFRVIALAPKDDYSIKLKEEGFEWINLPFDNSSTNPLKETMQIKYFHEIYKKVMPDIILHYTIKPNIYGTLAAKWLNIPSINNVSGLGTIFLNNTLSSKVAKQLYKFSFRYANKVFFQNDDDLNLFIENKLVSKKYTDRVPGSGIDIDKFKSNYNTQEEGDEIVFLFIARLIREKGIKEYIEAIKMIKDMNLNKQVKFQIIGDLYLSNPSAISQNELDSWISDDLIEYLGYQSDVKSFIEKSSCVVLPSYREGLSKSLLEAASMEIPIITTDVSGCRDVVEDGVNGYLCRVQDSDSLKEQFVKMIELSVDDREKMGQKGREKVINEFSDERVIDKYLTSIHTILSDN